MMSEASAQRRVGARRVRRKSLEALDALLVGYRQRYRTSPDDAQAAGAVRALEELKVKLVEVHREIDAEEPDGARRLEPSEDLPALGGADA